MADSFLRLPRNDRAELLTGLSTRLGKAPIVLEKDVWVCWILAELFAMPSALPMAFKGGTSLSKVYDAIHRFSEDIDITLSYRALDPSADPFAPKLSRSKLHRISDELRHRVAEHLRQAVVPHLQTALPSACAEPGAAVELLADNETVRVVYPSAMSEGASGYIPDSIKIEFGGRNSTEPREQSPVVPYLAPELPELAFPRATPFVLSPQRTFWEKATLIHGECGRAAAQPTIERKSRHWYDLAMLADGTIGQKALGDRTLLADVVKHKKAFFNNATANYDACTRGALCLIPEGQLLDVLRRDYSAMIEAGMFYKAPPSFKEILERLKRLQASINGQPIAA